MILKCENAAFSYDGRTIAENINFQIEERSIWINSSKGRFLEIIFGSINLGYNNICIHDKDL